LAVARALHITSSSMRISTSLAYLVLVLPAIAGADSKPHALPGLAKTARADTPDKKTLDATEVTERMKVWNDDITDCYLKAAGDVKGAGRLEIKLTIHRTGVVDAVDVATPGLSLRASKKVASCVKPLVVDTTFPARRAGTIAVVPYFYQRTDAPNSGPQYSCWDPKGCR
jgi:hypothetical protein